MSKTRAEIQRDYEKRTGYAAQKRSDKKNARRFQLKFAKSTEADLIKKLESEPNINGYIKALIRADLEKETGKAQ